MSEKGCLSCDRCGMDMDMDPYCVDESVEALRKAETGRDYPHGLSTSRAWSLCKGKFWVIRRSHES